MIILTIDLYFILLTDTNLIEVGEFIKINTVPYHVVMCNFIGK